MEGEMLRDKKVFSIDILSSTIQAAISLILAIAVLF